jgi:uncharacterized protein (TIGR03437 family)
MLKLTRSWWHLTVPVLISLCLVLSVMRAVNASGNHRIQPALSGNAPVAGFVSALQFAGDNSSNGSVTPGPDTAGLTALAVEAWVNPVSVSGRAEILAKDPLFFTLLDGKPSVYLGGTGNPGFHTSSTAVQAGVWSHVAATWDGMTVKIYLNGAETYSASTSGTTGSATPGSALGIGVCLTCAPLTTGFNGCLDEIRWWSTTRSAASIQAAMRQGLTGSESGLALYYRCDEPSGTTLSDATGNAHHATLTGSVMRKASGLADNFTTAEDTAFNGRLFGYDVENDTLTYSLITNGTKGIALISDTGTGAFTYTPASNQNGADSFTYKISDGSGDSAIVTVNVTITAVNDNPAITAGSPVTVQQNGSVSSVTIASVSDIESSAGSLTVTPTLPTGITVSNLTNTNGTITADISAACNAAAGANTIVLSVNDADGGSATASLTVNVTAQTVSLASHPISQTICPGSTALFTVAATGDGPFFYQWRKDGSPILGANSDNYSIVGAGASDVASYDCVITSVNGCTSVTSNAATVTLRTATSITSHPVSQTVCAGSPASFSVSADGTGTVSYQWRKNGSPISGATGSTFSLASASASDAGNYDCVVTAGCGSRTSSAATLTVNTAPTITSNPADRNTTVGATLHLTATADGSPTPEVRWQLSTDGGLNFNGINGATGTTLTLANVTLAMSGYKYRAIFSNNCGVTYSAISTLTVSPAATTITIAAGSGASVYGQAAAFTASVLSGSDPITEGTVTFRDGSTVLGTALLNGSGQALFTTTALGAGTHGISAVYNGTSNYLSSTTGATASHIVSKAPLTVTASNATKVYGAALPAFTATYSGFVNGDTSAVLSGSPDLTTTANAGSPVGTYPIAAAVGTLSAANYNFTFVSGTLTVTKAALIVVANNQTRTYGTANPALTYTFAGFVNGDTASVISGTPALSTSANSGSPVGAYPITVDVSSLSAVNYSFTASDGALIVNKAALTVKADDAARTYGATNPTFTYTITGFVNGDTASVVSGVPSLTTTAIASSPVGAYPISVSTSGLSAANYSFTSSDGTLTVNKAVLTIRADDKSKPYGAANPNFTYTFTGFVNGDSSAVVSGTPSLTTTANASSAVGTYPISVDTSGLSAANYSFSASSGTLTVTKAALTVKADDASRIYGAANPAFTYTITGFVNGDTASVVSGAPSLTTTAIASSPVGAYPISVSTSGLSAANYSFTASGGTLTVNKAALTIRADDKSKPYGAALPAFTASYSGFVNGDTAAVLSGSLNLATTATASSPAGAYSITASGVTAGNYNISFAGGTLTITTAAATLGVTANNSPVTWKQPVTFTVTVSKASPEAAAPTGTITFKDGATVLGTGTLNGSGQATLTLSSLSVGAHQITAEYSGDNNYAAANSSALSLAVNKASTTTTVVASANPVTVNQSVTFTATVSSTAGTPTGIVEFFDGATSLGTAPLSNGSAFVINSTLTAGEHAIRAVYSGDGNFAGSASDSLAQTINPACTYTLSTTSVIADVTSNTYNIVVTARGDCAWAATSNASWITLNSSANASGNGTVSFSVSALGNVSSRTGTLTIAGQTVTITQTRSFTVVSAASYDGTAISNDQVLAGFGTGVSPVTDMATSLPLTDTLSDVKVKIKDSAGVERLARLLFVSPNQINFIAPTGMANGTATVTVLNGDLEVAAGTITVASAAPGLFAANATGRGVAAALALRVKADSTQIYESVASLDSGLNQYVAVPIDLGPDADEVFLVLFCTGVRYRTSQNNVSVKIGNVEAEVVYAGAQPSFAGLDQINVRIPRSLIGRGEVEVVVTVDGRVTNPVTVSIK